MPSWLTELVNLLGVTRPFIYAAATYGFFRWLDKKASGPAKKAISDWLVPREYDRAAIAAAILELFDRVYTRPLLTWRAFLRSASITIGLTLFLLYEFGYITSLIRAFHSFVAIPDLMMTLFYNILPDFLSLFIVRRWLASSVNPIQALLFGPLIGIGLVIALLWLRIALLFEIFGADESFSSQSRDLAVINTLFAASVAGGIYGAACAAALGVHLWLPFFALCVGLLKGLNYFLLAANMAQWFLKRGKDHPLEVVGFVAAPLMFFGAAAFQMLASP